MIEAIYKGQFPQRVYRHPCPILVDNRLSMKAKFLWVYMLSKPPKEDGSPYQFAAVRIARENRDDVRAIRSAWKELVYLGYMKRWKSPDGRMHYRLYDEQYGPEAPYEGDYDFELSKEFSPWRDDCPSTLSSQHPDAHCTIEKFSEHLIFAYGLMEHQAWEEANEWANACKEGQLSMTWRNANQWAKHVARKYSKTQSAETAPISM